MHSDSSFHPSLGRFVPPADPRVLAGHWLILVGSLILVGLGAVVMVLAAWRVVLAGVLFGAGVAGVWIVRQFWALAWQHAPDSAPALVPTPEPARPIVVNGLRLKAPAADPPVVPVIEGEFREVSPVDLRAFAEAVLLRGEPASRGAWQGRYLPSGRRCTRDTWRLLCAGLGEVGVAQDGGERRGLQVQAGREAYQRALAELVRRGRL